MHSFFRESHEPGPDILCGKTGHDLPVLTLAPLDGEVFAAYTGPEGGITSISRTEEARMLAAGMIPNAATEDSEDFDYIDLDLKGEVGNSRRTSKDEASASKSIKKSSLENP